MQIKHLLGKHDQQTHGVNKQRYDNLLGRAISDLGMQRDQKGNIGKIVNTFIGDIAFTVIGAEKQGYKTALTIRGISRSAQFEVTAIQGKPDWTLIGIGDGVRVKKKNLEELAKGLARKRLNMLTSRAQTYYQAENPYAIVSKAGDPIINDIGTTPDFEADYPQPFTSAGVAKKKKRLPKEDELRTKALKFYFARKLRSL